jgi:hypothetical protein
MKTLRLAILLAMACAFSGAASERDVTLEFWADDGARVFLDGEKVIDDWRPCPEDSPRAHRTATVPLSPGSHRLVVEYFQGESLAQNDPDPAKLYWAIPRLGMTRTIVPANALFHTQADEESATPPAANATGTQIAGLAAHYFKDPTEWDGNWKPATTPAVDAKDWTFRDYQYTRVEPVINHLFVNRGWFSVRWVGYIEVPPETGKNPPNGNNGVGNGPDAQPPGNPPPNDLPGTGPGNPGSQGGANAPGQGNSSTHGNNGVGNGVDAQPPGNPPPNDLPGTSPGNPGNKKTVKRARK